MWDGGLKLTPHFTPLPLDRLTRVGEQLGGFVSRFTGKGVDEVFFSTVHGAGHMSPQWRPAAAWNMLDRFLSRKL